MASKAKAPQRDTIFSRRQIEGLLADGRSILILEQNVLKVDAWLDYHPGGKKAIQHLVGRDATDEIVVMHDPETVRSMLRYKIGRVEGKFENFVPPIQGGKYRRYVEGEDLDDEDAEEEKKDEDYEDISRTPSPVFDEEAVRRTRDNGALRSNSVSSVSSVEAEEPKDGMAFIDTQTKKEIRLDIEKYPSLDDATQDAIVEKYHELHEKVKAEGLYDCHYTSYMFELARYTTLFLSMLFFLRIKWYATSGFFLGVFWHQLVFAAHDSGHMGITHNYTIDSMIAMIIASWLGGLSMGWWKYTHNVHHIVTNSPEHDPDNQHIPIFAVNHRFFKSLYSTFHKKFMWYDKFAQIMVPYQAWTYYPVLCLARFNLYLQSYVFLIRGLGPRKGKAWWHRYFEILGNIFFWYWFGYLIVYKSIPNPWSRFVFVMVSHITTMPLHVQITLSHFAMSTTDLSPTESFAQKMLRTTMDVDCPPWLDFFHGGLQFQAVHHLYPRMPRHNLRRAQKLVMEFCRETGIPYALYGFLDGNRLVVGSLAEVGRQARILKRCQESWAMRHPSEVFYGD